MRWNRQWSKYNSRGEMAIWSPPITTIWLIWQAAAAQIGLIIIRTWFCGRYLKDPQWLLACSFPVWIQQMNNVGVFILLGARMITWGLISAAAKRSQKLFSHHHLYRFNTEHVLNVSTREGAYSNVTVSDLHTKITVATSWCSILMDLCSIFHFYLFSPGCLWTRSWRPGGHRTCKEHLCTS